MNVQELVSQRKYEQECTYVLVPTQQSCLSLEK